MSEDLRILGGLWNKSSCAEPSLGYLYEFLAAENLEEEIGSKPNFHLIIWNKKLRIPNQYGEVRPKGGKIKRS